MKKITLFLLILTIAFSAKAQDGCTNAISIVEGATTTAAGLTGTVNNLCWSPDNATVGDWYTYTATVTGIINISSNLPQNDGLGLIADDTRLSVFTGSCPSSLTCYTGGDDVDDSNYLTDVTFECDSGVTYYFQWDDYWDDRGFDFVLTETAVSCPDGSLPMSEGFDDVNKFVVCWENIDDDVDGYSWYTADYDLLPPTGPDGNPCLASASWNGNAGPLTPDNWLVSYAIDLSSYNTGDTIDLTWIARGVDALFPAENYTVYASNSNVIATLAASPVFFNETLVRGGDPAGDGVGDGVWTPTRTLDISSLAGQMVYIAFRHHDITDQFVLNIDDVAITWTLSDNDLVERTFKYYYDTDHNTLTLKSPTSTFSNIQLFDILGQQVLNNKLSRTEESLDLSNLTDGIYIGKVEIDDNVQTIKLLKQ